MVNVPVEGAETKVTEPVSVYCPEALHEDGLAVNAVMSQGVTMAQSAEPAPGEPVLV